MLQPPSQHTQHTQYALRPENVFIDERGAAVLGDFGLAINRVAERPVSRVGTPGFQAPEVCVFKTLIQLLLRSTRFAWMPPPLPVPCVTSCLLTQLRAEGAA